MKILSQNSLSSIKSSSSIKHLIDSQYLIEKSKSYNIKSTISNSTNKGDASSNYYITSVNNDKNDNNNDNNGNSVIQKEINSKN